MRKTSLLAGAALLLGAYTATAAEDYTCATPPTCAELGYDQSVSDCSGKKTLKCPFDKTKVFCVGDCESEGYALVRKSDNLLSFECCVGQTKVTCPYDSRYFKCTGECAGQIDPGKRCVNAGYTLGGESVDGQLTIKFCLAGQTKVTCPYDSQYFKCEGEAAEFEPVLPEKGCPVGEYSSEEACTRCQYGSLPGSKSGCYKCGTYSECNGFDGGKFCLMCNKVDKL